MTGLHPSIESIERAYAAWLQPPEESVSRIEPEDVPAVEPASVVGGGPPHHIADAIRRQVRSAPQRRVPDAGDLVVIPAPDASGEAAHEPQNPVVVLLDERTDAGWSGWLVGAHVDYAGDRDLVLDSTLIDGHADPAPIAGMVLCWDRVAIDLPGEAEVLHRLTGGGLRAVRALERAGGDEAIAPAPGHMTLREIVDADAVVVTGTPYLDDDPRTPYLRLARELARRVSEPQYDDQGRVRRPDRDDPER